MRVMAIDPGSTHSAWVVIDDDYKPRHFAKTPNYELLSYLDMPLNTLVIEMIGHYGTGMSAGKDVYDTCIWIGRFIQAYPGEDAATVKRATVKAHICGSAKANDGNVIRALIDRFAPGVRNHGRGIKNEPAWFYGFHTDIWQAYALAVYWMDTQKENAA